MALPAAKIQTEEIELSGGTVTVRGLSRAEALRMAEHGDNVRELEIDVIATATGTPPKDAADWYEEASSQDVEQIVKTVLRLSGMDGELGKGSSAD